MKNKSIFKKLMFIFAANSVVVLAGFIFIASYYLKQNNIKVFTEDLKASAAILAPYITELYNAGNFEKLNAYIKQNTDAAHRITVVSAGGVVVADSRVDVSSMENHLNRAEISEVFKSGVSTYMRHSSTLHEDLLYVAVPLYKNGEKVAALRINAPVRNITLLSKDFVTKTVFALAAMLLLSLITIYLFSGLTAGRIEEVKNAFAKLAGGDFEVRTHINSGDELEELSNAFNLTSEKMAALFAETEKNRAELSGIIESVQDIVIVINAQGVVTLSNKPGQRQKHYWEIPGLSVLGGYIGKTDTAQIALGDKYYDCSLAKIKNSGDTAVVMHDITEIKNLETIKNEFISNMSHELKTPLSSIKAYLELIDGEKDGATKTEYLSIISRNTSRLANIVNDILLLSSAEDKRPLRRENFNLRAVLKETGVLLAQKARDKGLSLNISDSDLFVTGDKFYVEQMLINLVDNAIRYTERGQIDVTAQNTGEGIKITVSDTGIGISKENQPRIFERFFVTDKSRSKKTGGTGLGLAIVKHIAEMHGGKVTLESEPQKGSSFTVTLP